MGGDWVDTLAVIGKGQPLTSNSIQDGLSGF